MMPFDFSMGAQVHCKNGIHGKLTGLVVEPDTLQVKAIIVREGFILSRSHVLPMSLVQSALEDMVYLSLDSHELVHYPEYRVTEYEQPAAGYEQPVAGGITFNGMNEVRDPIVPMIKQKIHEGIAAGQVVIAHGMTVRNLDGSVGKVDHVIVDRASEKITHFVVHRGRIFTDHFVVPIAAVENLDQDGISLAGTNEMLNQFSRYSPETVDRVLVE